jgi:sphingomyelin phosphodiesterase
VVAGIGADDDAVTSWECTGCKALVSLLQDLFLKNATEDEIVKIITAFCIDLKIEDELVCRGIVTEFKDEVLSVFDEIALGPNELCGIVIGPSCGSPYDPYNQTWTVKLPSTPKPPVKPVPPPKAGSPTTRILFISDIHFDKNYTPGLNAECGEPLCCRPPNGAPPPGKRAAGFWGDYNCDSTIHLLDNLFSHLKNISSQFDWVYMTGDLPAHNVWNQTREDQLYILKVITDFFKTYLPNKIVYPALGNHESAPVDSFPPLTITGPNSNQWLRDALAEYWSNWLPSDTIATIKKGGYYTTLIRKGLRLISLNMNYCNNNNWWLLINSTDPAQQLEWLVDVLQTAEDKGEKVHIIGHIHPGGSCLKTWSWQYYKVINRYESTVINQFFGHAHTDFFEMFYDEKDNDRPTNIAFVGPSVTTYTGLNPGFRIYTLDGDYDNSSQVWRPFWA